jgi:hypothetical protein
MMGQGDAMCFWFLSRFELGNSLRDRHSRWSDLRFYKDIEWLAWIDQLELELNWLPEIRLPGRVHLHGNIWT